jgi:hypothetical protein
MTIQSNNEKARRSGNTATKETGFKPFAKTENNYKPAFMVVPDEEDKDDQIINPVPLLKISGLLAGIQLEMVLDSGASPSILSRRIVD